MDNYVLKAVECGRYGGEVVLPKVMLEFLNVILNRRKGFAYMDGGGVALDEQKYVTDALWGIFDGLRSDDVFLFKGSVEPQVEDVVCHTSKLDESTMNDG